MADAIAQTEPAADPVRRPGEPGDSQPAVAGVVAALVGFTSTFALILAGLRAVGATSTQASSGLLVVSVTMGALGIFLSLRTRMPIMIAWSTPGAALLIAGGSVGGGYPAALGAFLVSGLLITVCGLWHPLERWITAIPAPLASAMLAGVLLPVCLAPVHAVVDEPWLAAPPIIVWAVLTRFARRWAAPGALVVAMIAIAIDRTPDLGGSAALPHVVFTSPSFDLGTLVGIAIPLFVVTMASQNVPGMAVLSTFGYRPRLRPLLVSTGAATALTAPFGVLGINLAAITAAMAAGPDSHPDPARRWVAALSASIAYLFLGLLAGVATVLVATAPPVVIEAVAGLALLGAFAGAIGAALSDDERREAAVVTFVVSASAVTIAGIGAPFWGLLAGLAFRALQRAGRGHEPG